LLECSESWPIVECFVSCGGIEWVCQCVCEDDVYALDEICRVVVCDGRGYDGDCGLYFFSLFCGKSGGDGEPESCLLDVVVVYCDLYSLRQGIGV